jgi:hypothetical protein
MACGSAGLARALACLNASKIVEPLRLVERVITRGHEVLVRAGLFARTIIGRGEQGGGTLMPNFDFSNISKFVRASALRHKQPIRNGRLGENKGQVLTRFGSL